MLKTRWMTLICWRSARPASTGRWFGPQDYERFAGFEARVELTRPIEGRRRFRGRIGELADGTVRIIESAGEYRLPLEQIDKAKLVMTDELLAAASADMKRTS